MVSCWKTATTIWLYDLPINVAEGLKFAFLQSDLFWQVTCARSKSKAPKPALSLILLHLHHHFSNKLQYECLFVWSFTPHSISSWSVYLHTLFLACLRPPKQLTSTKFTSDNGPSWMSRRGRIKVENISWSISTEVMWLGWVLNSQLLDLKKIFFDKLTWFFNLVIFRRLQLVSDVW